MATKPKIGPNRGNAGKGRPKGAKNKLTVQVKAMIEQALTEAGGVEYLKRQSEENPTAFLTLIGKLLPLQVNGAGEDGEHLTEITFRVKHDGKPGG